LRRVELIFQAPANGNFALQVVQKLAGFEGLHRNVLSSRQRNKVPPMIDGVWMDRAILQPPGALESRSKISVNGPRNMHGSSPTPM
jgi:hypothetical protein